MTMIIFNREIEREEKKFVYAVNCRKAHTVEEQR